MKRRLTAVTLSALLGLGLAACPGDQEPAARDTPPPPTAGAPTTPAPAADPALEAGLPPGVTAQMVQQGRDLYHGQAVCFTCHGQNGTGSALGPALNDQDWIHLTSGDMDELRTVIRTGVQRPVQYQSPMPAMGGAQLNDEQLESVTAYVYAISHGLMR
jgi:mono/diheme cytochrome c family protein